MSLISERLDANLPLNVDHILRLATKLGYAKQYESIEMPKDLKKMIITFLKAQSKDIRGYKAKQCYFNSQMLTLNTNFESMRDRFQYCEGYWMSPSIPIGIPHAWCVLDGKYVIDTTLTFDLFERKKDLSDRAIGSFPEGWEYYGICIDRSEILETLMKFQESVAFLDDYRVVQKRIKQYEAELAQKKNSQS